MKWRFASNLHCLQPTQLHNCAFAKRTTENGERDFLGTAMAARWGCAANRCSAVGRLRSGVGSAVLLGWKAMEDIATHYSACLCENFTLLKAEDCQLGDPRAVAVAASGRVGW
jgi:hypothetical protein